VRSFLSLLGGNERLQKKGDIYERGGKEDFYFRPAEKERLASRGSKERFNFQKKNRKKGKKALKEGMRNGFLTPKEAVLLEEAGKFK